MIREQIASQSYIDWLKSLGCLVYLPLSANGDLQDRISGLSLQLTGQGSMVWDNAQHMYKVTHASNGTFNYVALLDNGLAASQFQNDNYTVLQNIMMVTNSSSKYICSFSPKSKDSSTCEAASATWGTTCRTNAFPRTLAHCGYVCNHTLASRSWYQNGVQAYTSAEYVNYLPSNWVMDGTGITIGCNLSYQRYGVQYYISEIYLFNTALDLATIRKIQGYE